MTALDTARLMWLINGTSDKEQVLWEKPNGKPITAAELSDSSRKFLKGLLAQQGFNEVLSTSNFGTYREFSNQKARTGNWLYDRGRTPPVD